MTDASGRPAPMRDLDFNFPVAVQATASVQEELWLAFQRDHATATRRALLEGYLSLIRFVAMKLAAKLPGCVDINDLMQEGYLGLDKAIDAFDPDRGVQFSTFAVKRIWGAMMDGLRADDYKRRTQRRRSQRLESARREMMTESGRPPTEEEIAERLGISEEEFSRLWGDTRMAPTGRLWGGQFDDPDGGSPGRQMLPPDPHAEDPTEAAQREDLKQLLLRGFTRAERLIVVLYYYEDLTMKEIGETLDISESRVSQMHSLLVKRIRAVMQAWELE
jgi:RNA polymerase sigma factor FliA